MKMAEKGSPAGNKAITNGGFWSIFEVLSPAQTFVLVDS